jgi:polar amino acid transport system substrate-binding protein
VIRNWLGGVLFAVCFVSNAFAGGPDCSRPFTLGFHDHGLLYSLDTDSGIDKDFAGVAVARSGSV